MLLYDPPLEGRGDLSLTAMSSLCRFCRDLASRMAFRLARAYAAIVRMRVGFASVTFPGGHLHPGPDRGADS